MNHSNSSVQYNIACIIIIIVCIQCVCVLHWCSSLRTTSRSWLSSLVLWVLRLEVR